VHDTEGGKVVFNSGALKGTSGIIQVSHGRVSNSFTFSKIFSKGNLAFGSQLKETFPLTISLTPKEANRKGARGFFTAVK
jgi:hypothetical protein